MREGTKAIAVKEIDPGRQRLFKLDPPHEGHEFVMSSRCRDKCAEIQGCFEVYLFAADADGEVTDWCELGGSQKNCSSVEQPLIDLGYSIVNDN